jgi:hypothetical protein
MKRLHKTLLRYIFVGTDGKNTIEMHEGTKKRLSMKEHHGDTEVRRKGNITFRV